MVGACAVACATVWAAHVWFEPGTMRPAYAATDPWCRQGSEALHVPACAFFPRHPCP